LNQSEPNWIEPQMCLACQNHAFSPTVLLIIRMTSTSTVGIATATLSKNFRTSEEKLQIATVIYCRSRVFRVVSERRRQRDDGFRASGRPHLRPNVEKSRRERSDCQRRAHSTPDVTARWWTFAVAVDICQVQLPTMLKTNSTDVLDLQTARRQADIYTLQMLFGRVCCLMQRSTHSGSTSPSAKHNWRLHGCKANKRKRPSTADTL